MKKTFTLTWDDSEEELAAYHIQGADWAFAYRELWDTLRKLSKYGEDAKLSEAIGKIMEEAGANLTERGLNLY